MTMRYGMVLPGGTAPEQLEQAVLAERAGWDGVFVWEAAYGVDAWTLLAAMAARTTRVRLGTLLTPLPWRRPWKVASQVATLDQLSGGRAVLAVGLGAVTTDLPLTGEALDLRARAELLDEGIDLIRELWAGGTAFRGRHYEYYCGRDDLSEVGRPVQQRIPIWVVGAWPRPKSMRRALRCDGVIPQYPDGGTPDDARAVRAWLNEHGARPDVDLVAEGETPATEPVAARDQVLPWAEAGCTWWLETRWEMPHQSAERMAEVCERLAAGPPAVDTPIGGTGLHPAGGRAS
jgi:alkanesulfonate monooxygenase SsuD/methylene tetrahydromethanopterin reductase-like flavin-dependent oxidoreductase (luciferase family)